MFKNRSFNVKIVNDKLAADSDEKKADPVQGILTAQAYAAIAKDLIELVTYAVIGSAVIIYGAKTASTVISLAARRLFR